MRKYKLIIFDFDGTICATHEAIIYCFMQTFKKFGVELPSQEEIHATINKGLGLNDSFKLLNSALVTDAETKIWVESYREIYRTESEDKTYLFKNGKEVFKQLHAAGILIVIVSNKGINAITSALDRFGLKEYTKLIVGDTKDIKKKPDPMIFDAIIKPNFPTICSGDILVVGDTTADILFAKNIGVDSCWASYGYGQKDECVQLTPTYIIRELTEIVWGQVSA